MGLRFELGTSHYTVRATSPVRIQTTLQTQKGSMRDVEQEDRQDGGGEGSFEHKQVLDFFENPSQLLVFIGRLVEIEKPQEEDLNIKLQR